jgi:hypothetical protein
LRLRRERSVEEFTKKMKSAVPPNVIQFEPHRMARHQLGLAFFVALGLTACGSPSPRSSNSQPLSRIKDKSLVVSIPSTRPDFRAFTPGKAGFSLVGDVFMRSEGNRIVNDNAVADPTIAIARDLAQALGDSGGPRLAAGSAPIVSDNDSPAALSAGVSGAALVMRVRTRDWRTWYYTTNFNRYRARVEVSAELIDTSTQTVVAKARCDESSPISADASPTYDEMVGAGAQRLKDELARAQSACVLALKKGLFGG